MWCEQEEAKFQCVIPTVQEKTLAGKGEMNMKIVGVSRCDFVAKDGTHVKGFNVYLEKPLDSGAEAIGVMTQNIYLSESKMNKFGLDINTMVGSHVEVRFNSYGKPSKVSIKN